MKSVIDTLRKEGKWNYIKWSVKITRDRKSVEDKNRDKEQGNKQKTTINIDYKTTIFIINVLDLNKPFKRDCQSGSKNTPTYMLSTKDPL